MLLLTGCSRQPSPSESVSESAGGPDQANLPFDRTPDKSGVSPSSSFIRAESNAPAGTPLTIRLISSISAATARPGDFFQATLEEPITMQGKTIVPSGNPVTGEVMEVNSSARVHKPAYLRLQLTSVAIGSRAIPIETSSILAKAGVRSDSSAAAKGGTAAPTTTDFVSVPGNKILRFDAGRRLTFRLTAPVSFP